MKKGCFIKTIIILTILTAAVIYLVKNNWQEWVVRPGKKIVVDLAMNSVEKELKQVQTSALKDSLVSEMKLFLENKFNKTDELSDKDLSFIAGSLKAASFDSVITETEFRNLKQLIRSRTY